MEVYNKKTDIPKLSKDNAQFSVDVITCDEDDMLNIGYYSFEDNKWHFHTETLVDYYEKGKEMNFVWMYKPNELRV